MYNIDGLTKLIIFNQSKLQKMIELSFGSEKSKSEIDKQTAYLISLITKRTQLAKEVIHA